MSTQSLLVSCLAPSSIALVCAKKQPRVRLQASPRAVSRSRTPPAALQQAASGLHAAPKGGLPRNAYRVLEGSKDTKGRVVQGLA
ncbi:hypothetical protein C8Q77DRAFT_1088254 [Trametes polyzona]|nr:hypothetical protein C8Q77DRAFT_1088254 [Trametes polyzona]